MAWPVFNVYYFQNAYIHAARACLEEMHVQDFQKIEDIEKIFTQLKTSKSIQRKENLIREAEDNLKNLMECDLPLKEATRARYQISA